MVLTLGILRVVSILELFQRIMVNNLGILKNNVEDVRILYLQLLFLYNHSSFLFITYISALLYVKEFTSLFYMAISMSFLLH